MIKALRTSLLEAWANSAGKTPHRRDAHPRRAQRRRHILALAVCLQFPAAASVAESSLNAIQLVGSRPLLAYALSESASPEIAREVAGRFGTPMGYGGTGFGTVTERSLRMFPSLRFDGNINGGFENSHFGVGGYNFAVDPDAQAKSGVLVGANFSADVRGSLVKEVAFDAHAEGSFEVSPAHGLSKSSLYADLCLRHRAALNMYFHSCVDGSRRRLELGESTQAGLRVGATRLLAFGGGFHELSGEIRFDEHFRSEFSYTQRVASFGIRSALSGSTALFAKIDLGTDEPGVMTMQKRLQVGLTRLVFGQPTSISVGWQESSGGMFFGTPRVDHTVTGQIRRTVSKHLSVGLMASKTNSTVEFFERESIGAQVNFRY